MDSEIEVRNDHTLFAAHCIPGALFANRLSKPASSRALWKTNYNHVDIMGRIYSSNGTYLLTQDLIQR